MYVPDQGHVNHVGPTDWNTDPELSIHDDASARLADFDAFLLSKPSLVTMFCRVKPCVI